MNYDWIDQYILDNKGTVKMYQKEWDANKYLLNNKMFIYVGMIDKTKEDIITLKLEPSYSEMLRNEYSNDIIPGYYMNKIHWTSIKLNGNVKDEVIKEAIYNSYTNFIKGLPKKVQLQFL